VKVVLRNPRRELEVRGPKTVTALLAELDVNAESVLVIADDELVARDARLPEGATVEIRPVMSGGCEPGPGARRRRAQAGAR
jgi:sulfur carrier protein